MLEMAVAIAINHWTRYKIYAIASYMAKLHEHNILLPFLHTEFINHGIIIIIEHASYALLYLL